MQIAGPEAQLVEAAREFSSLESLPASGLTVQRLQISRITAEPELATPRVVFSFDLDGTLGGVAVSALGVERVPMQRADSRWQPIGSPLPRLEQTLAALRPESKGVKRWLIRVDVKHVEVTAERTDGTDKRLLFDALADGGLERRR